VVGNKALGLCVGLVPRRPVNYTQALPSSRDVMSCVYTLGRLCDYGFTVMVRRFLEFGAGLVLGLIVTN